MSCNAGALTVGTRAAFAGDDLLCEQTMAALLAGVSTRTLIAGQPKPRFLLGRV